MAKLIQDVAQKIANGWMIDWYEQKKSDGMCVTTKFKMSISKKTAIISNNI